MVAVAPGILGVAAGAAGSGTGVIGGGVVEAPVWGAAATLWWTGPAAAGQHQAEGQRGRSAPGRSVPSNPMVEPWRVRPLKTVRAKAVQT